MAEANRSGRGAPAATQQADPTQSQERQRAGLGHEVSVELDLRQAVEATPVAVIGIDVEPDELRVERSETTEVFASVGIQPIGLRKVGDRKSVV